MSPQTNEADTPVENRLLVALIQYQLDQKMRTAKDFLRHFPPEHIMTELTDHAEYRATILHDTIGINRSVALKRTPQESTAMLEDALEDAIVEDTVVTAFPPSQWVIFLNNQLLWNFLSESGFWKLHPTDSGFAKAQAFIRFALEQCLSLKLLTLDKLVNDVMGNVLAVHLPEKQRASVGVALLKQRALNEFPGDEEIFHAIGWDAYMDNIPLESVWESLIINLVAKPLRLLPGTMPVVTESVPPAPASSNGSVFDANALEGNPSPKH